MKEVRVANKDVDDMRGENCLQACKDKGMKHWFDGNEKCEKKTEIM